MGEVNTIGLGIVFAIVGLLFFGLARFLVRSVPTLRPNVVSVGLDGSTNGMIGESLDAVLMVEAGGRLHSLNQSARDVFHLLPGDTADLDRIAHRVRPSEEFIALCAKEGRGSFTLDGRRVEIDSYPLMVGEPMVMVVLRFADLAVGLEESDGGLGAQTLRAFTELSTTMAASLDLPEAVRAILEGVDKLVPADYLELTVWDSEQKDLAVYRLIGLLEPERVLEPIVHVSAGEGYSGVLYRDRQTLVIPDVNKRSDIRPGEGRMPGLRSFLGIALQVGKEFVGTIELASRTADEFHEQDIALLHLISGQAAVALHNALLYLQERRRSAELSGLAQLAGAFSSLRDPKELFTRLVASITPLFEVEILGFIMYNENQRMLKGQIPFHGLPDQFIDLFSTIIQPGSTAERIFLDRDVLITEDASADPQWGLLGLDHLAQAASLRDTVLIPIISGGRMLGYLQASNHLHDPSFSQSELHLLAIIADQSASIIDNAFLVQQSSQRVQRSEVLRQIVVLASSAVSLDEILTFAVSELARLLRADIGAIFLVDAARTVMQLHRPSLVGELDALPERSRRLLLDDPQFSSSVADTQSILRLEHNGPAPVLIPFYQSVVAAWKVASLIAVPLVVRGEGVGEVWFGSVFHGFFDHADVQLVSTAAGQLAGAVEQVFLRTQTDDGLRLRLERLVSVSRISRELNNTLDIKQLIQLIHREGLHTTGAECGCVVFFDLSLSADAAPLVKHWHGDLHEPTLSEAETRVVDSAMAARIDSYLGIDEPPPHAGIFSALIVPIIYQQRVAGLIVLHGTVEGQFSETDQDICQTLAVQAGFALANAMQYEDQTRRSALLARELDTIAELLQVSQLLRPSLPLEQSLTAIGGAVRQATPFQVNVISQVNPDTMMLERVCSIGLPLDQWADLRKRTQPWGSIQQLMLPEFRYGSVYFIPADKSPALPQDVYTITVSPEGTRGGADGWDPDDFILVPLFDSNNFPLGLISVDAPSDGRRPDRPTFEALEIFGIQAALMIENHRRTSFLENRVAGMEVELGRLQQTTGSAIQNLPVLLRKDLEQTVSLQALNRRIDRVRASLEIAAVAASQVDPESILRSLARELLTRFALQNALIAVKDAVGIRLMDVIGTVPAAVNPEALFGQRNPLRQLMVENGIQESDVLLIANLENSAEWNNSPLLKAMEARSVIGLLLSGGEDLRFGVLVVGRRSLAAFSEEDRRIFMQLAQQVGVGLQNRQLLTETQHSLNDVNLLLDFSLKLSGLPPEEILASLVETALEAVREAQAGWAGLWDERRGALVPLAALGYADTEAFSQIAFRRPTGSELTPLPLRILDAGTPLRKGTINFAAEYYLAADDLLRYRQATRGQLPDSALILPLRLGDTVSGVLMLENFDQSNAFSAEDEALAYSLTQQAALSLDNARLYQATSQRAAQMLSLTRVSSLLTSSLKREELIVSLLDWLARVIPYQTAILWMREDKRLMVRAVRGFADDAGLLGISVAEEEPGLFRDVLNSGEPVVVPDVREDERFPRLVEPENLSWVGLPLSVHGECIGLLVLEGRETGFFTPEQVGTTVTFSSQAAVALENARLFEESLARAEEMDQRSQRLALLNRLSGELGQTLDVNQILVLTAQQLVAALGAAGAAGILIGPGGAPILEVEVPQRAHLPLALLDVPLLERLRETQGLFSTAEVDNEVVLGKLVDLYCQPRSAQSLLFIPLLTGQTLFGWMMIDRSESYRFLPAEMELARTVCNQAAAAIQNARLFDETRSLTEFLERRVEERTGELRKEHRNSQTLLRVISELSTSLDMNLVLNRTLGVINESFGAQESLIYMLQGASQRPYRAGDGLASGGSINLEKEIMRKVAHGRSTFISGDVTRDERFAASDEELPAYRSILAVPLMMGEDALGALMLFHRDADFFHAEQMGLAETTARQLGIAINNAELFNLIRDQSENLGNMLREQQIESSRSRAILEAVADGVVVTDDQGRITLYNHSAERILGMKSGETLGQNLDSFGGLFLRSGSLWLDTIHAWMKDANTHQDETFTDRFELDNGSVIEVSLAPVLWRTQFLGTVSIFRDISHEVQIDRLKSEFVANVSHELRTPMTSIKGYVEIMLMGATGELSEQQSHFLSIVKMNTERLNVLVNDLLDVSRMEMGRVVLNMQALNLREVVDDVVLDVRRRSQEENKPMRFEVVGEPDLPAVTGDIERVRQIVSSLIANGYNYTPAEGLVEVSLRVVNHEVQVDVQDNGIGIHPDDQHRIFERFYRGDDPLVLASAGTGLGLAIARGLVEMHNGRIWFNSSGVRGEGSTFSFTLPIHEG